MANGHQSWELTRAAQRSSVREVRVWSEQRRSQPAELMDKEESTRLDQVLVLSRR